MSEHEYGGIRFPGHEAPRQIKLAQSPGYRATELQVHPPVRQDLAALDEVLDPSRGPLLGIDLEFKENLTPTIVSVTRQDLIWSAPWSPEVATKLQVAFTEGKYHWIAHSGIAADKPVIEKALGIKTPLAEWGDSLISHWLCNMCLAKAPTKDESDDAGSLGFNSLWHMASLVTDAFCWKACRGYNCDGPCPYHSPIDYCGVDAWAGLVGYQEHLRIMERRHLPVANYRQAMHLSDICYRMEQQGVAVDREFVAKANANFDTIKDALFEDNIFNPKSPKQVMEWFSAHGVQLRKTEKETIKKALEKAAKKHSVTPEELDSGLNLPPVVDALNRLYKFKFQGKGLDPWFADKYFGKDGLLHPRFIVPGTSTSRLSSSAPNFMNIPKRGAMAIARQAIIPRDPGLDIICPDVAQLELRTVLWYAGVDQSIIGADAFNWLVAEAGGAFDEATKLVENKKARDLAKVASHGGNYMLGFKLISPTELSSKRVQEEITAGALRVYTRKYMPRLKKDWTFMGKIVAFSGAKLAEMLYGNTSYDSRRKTHLILEDVYFNKFFAIREWQMRVLEFVETNGYVQSTTGRFLQLYGTDYEEWAKVAIAFLGQGTSAEHVQAMMRRYDSEFGVIPLIQVHDELVFEIPRDWSDEYVMGPFIRPMVEELDVLPGFKVPVEVKRGPNWKQTRVLGKAHA